MGNSGAPLPMIVGIRSNREWGKVILIICLIPNARSPIPLTWGVEVVVKIFYNSYFLILYLESQIFNKSTIDMKKLLQL
ncbi:hypothetical protein NIES592_07555 [Fischerella major NIES-592]|uniref:Uncharacterized protein n=1 Tax=Fischerella major NIES-592 TaxID=210994 RepID=A0A1U7H192_9CYAN|nr:hypothetical protein NIES592_07555 [Fischerella major NIES-592]